jgi:hypothetical protein
MTMTATIAQRRPTATTASDSRVTEVDGQSGVSRGSKNEYGVHSERELLQDRGAASVLQPRLEKRFLARL